jgi:hypothetical protein
VNYNAKDGSFSAICTFCFCHLRSCLRIVCEFTLRKHLLNLENFKTDQELLFVLSLHPLLHRFQLPKDRKESIKSLEFNLYNRKASSVSLINSRKNVS